MSKTRIILKKRYFFKRKIALFMKSKTFHLCRFTQYPINLVKFIKLKQTIIMLNNLRAHLMQY